MRSGSCDVSFLISVCFIVSFKMCFLHCPSCFVHTRASYGSCVLVILSWCACLVCIWADRCGFEFSAKFVSHCFPIVNHLPMIKACCYHLTTMEAMVNGGECSVTTGEWGAKGLWWGLSWILFHHLFNAIWPFFFLFWKYFPGQG